jgi:hypothetical protein
MHLPVKTSLSTTIKSHRDELNSNRDGLDGNREELNSQRFSPQTLIACIFTAKALFRWHFVDLLSLGRSPSFLFSRRTHILLLKTLANLLDLTAILRFLH